MDGVHDMGGMHGFGPVPINEDEPVFPESWQGRVFACNLALAISGGGNIDRFRYLLERLPPAQYLSSSYYERWLAAMTGAVEASGMLQRDAAEGFAAPPEIARAIVDTPAGVVRDMSGEAAFNPGDQVRARNLHPPGHIRLPRYVRGRVGEIVSDNGNQYLPDVRAATGEVVPQRLYTVSFSARELWGEQANPNDSVCVDLWESYLEPA